MKVDSAEFEVLADPPLPDWRVRIVAVGEDFTTRAAPIEARVGDQPVEGLMPRADASGFTGFVREEPAAGDRLFVGYLDDGLEETVVVQRRGVG
jgi:hypothetical protein